MRHPPILTLWLGLACLLAVGVSLAVGEVALPVGDVLLAVVGGADPLTQTVVSELRLPRAVAALTVGMALGVSGAALQGLLRNPLAEPGVMGVSAAAVLGAALVLQAGLTALIPVPVAAIVGALAATVLVAMVAQAGVSLVTLVLVGVGVSSLAGALLALLVNLTPDPMSLLELLRWTMGSVAHRSWADLSWAVPLVVFGVVLMATQGRALAVLGLGEETATTLGVSVPRVRLAVVVGAGLATGAAVALAGAVGFVGLVAAHLVRPWVGHDPGRAMLPAGLAGGVLLVLADTGVRMLPGPQELNLGVLAALVGAPAFIAIALSRATGRAGGPTDA